MKKLVFCLVLCSLIGVNNTLAIGNHSAAYSPPIKKSFCWEGGNPPSVLRIDAVCTDEKELQKISKAIQESREKSFKEVPCNSVAPSIVIAVECDQK